MAVLDWLRKLMTGDQGAAPPGAKVERDALGRVTRVDQTLSLFGGGGTTYPRLAPVDAFAPRLREACAWLTSQNILLAREHALGLEQDYTFDQDTGELVLRFGEGHALVLRAEVLGSFDPSDRSFMWGWANPSIVSDREADATRLKADGERLGLAALTTPVQIVTFDELQPLIALAAHDAGADGVYRCIVNDSSSVFLSIRIESAPTDISNTNSALFDAARDLAARYDAEMLALDLEYHERSGEEDILGPLIDRKMAVYKRYWSRDDNYWKPCSTGWPSDHDPDTRKLHFSAPHPAGGALDIAIGKTFGQTAYRIELVDGVLRITDNLIEWGDGLIWPDAPP
ncbi:hypothetical protein P1X14_15445 [Sphingomonas sp. AOB5]|uniref:DUF6882 domain-containing protein n=1 Tax=Sphingomonas sp. AOB5 TaxID=3034017 RepID=UPI0023F92426|nr:DUF6882 domain-containing protein [Sphingomonas sp. AOB5]MDF7776651.1 hypothetical protein [Sphingomonas sp. AOB5]